MGCYIWYSEEGSGRAGAGWGPLLAVPNTVSIAGREIAGHEVDGREIAGHEIARHEFAGQNARHEIAGHKNARLEIAGQKNRNSFNTDYITMQFFVVIFETRNSVMHSP